MTLPDLPRQNKASEADFGIRFRRWWERTKMPGNFELKHVRGRAALPFSDVKAQQIAVGNMAASEDGILLRVASGTVGAPDYIGQVSQPVWIVISYPRFFCVISLAAFLEERNRGLSRSLSLERAKEISTVVV